MCCSLMCALAARGNGQTSLAQVNGQTTPETTAQLAWQTIFTSGCKSAPDALFLAFEVNAARDDGMRRLGQSVWWRLNEYRATSLHVDPEKLTTADTLNGVQWNGTATLNVDAFRKIENRRVDTTSWSGWQESEGNPVLRLWKKNGKWSVFLNGYLPGNPSLLLDGVPQNPEFLDYKISCEEATSAQPLARYSQNFSQPEAGQWFCPGAVLGGYAGPDLVITSPTQIQAIERNYYGGTAIYIAPRKGNMDMGYGIKRGHAQASCAQPKVR